MFNPLSGNATHFSILLCRTPDDFYSSSGVLPLNGLMPAIYSDHSRSNYEIKFHLPLPFKVK